MQVRLVDPQTLKVVRTYSDMTTALADASAPPKAIWCETDSDEGAAIQAVERIRAAQVAMENHAARERHAGADQRAKVLLRRARDSVRARRTILEWSVRNALTDNGQAADDLKLREVNALLAEIDDFLGL